MSRAISITPAVAAALEAAEIEGNVVRLAGQLDRAVYQAVNKVLEAVGGAWDRRVTGHVFRSDPARALAEALASGSARAPISRKQELQFFETPDALADRMAVAVRAGPGMLVLEPSAGHGRLVKPVLARGGAVEAVEIDPEKAGVLRSVPGLSVHQADFPAWVGGRRREFDAVVMNPPFARNQDVRHVALALNLLKPGGRLAAIVSEHAFIGRERACADFRAMVNRLGLTVEALPPGTFREAGTMAGSRLIRGVAA